MDQPDRSPRQDPRGSAARVVWASLRSLFTGAGDTRRVDPDEGYPRTTLGTLGGPDV